MASVLVTGANRGIGLEFVKQYAERGDTVYATCRTAGKADALREVASGNANVVLLELDLNDNRSIADFPQRLQGAAIDIFINNAGVYGPRDGGFGKVRGEDFIAVLQVNSVAPLLLTQALMQNLQKGKQKKLLYLTSKMGSIADNAGGGHYMYRSSKTALNMVASSLAVDLREEGFVVAVLHPGWVQTDMGGPNAHIDTGTSVTGMMAVIDQLSASDSGAFFNYDGSKIPW